MRKLISTARSGRTRRMARPPIPMLDLYRKGEGKEAKLCFMGHGLMENRHGLLVDACLTLADGHRRAGGRTAYDRAACRPAGVHHAGRRQTAMTRKTSSMSCAR